jgi:hypothetical protein
MRILRFGAAYRHADPRYTEGMHRRSEGMMEATTGDRISVVAAKTGSVTREGEILEVIEGEFHVRYRVQWTDGHESLFSPGPGVATVLPGSKPTADKSTAKPTARGASTKRAAPKKPSAKKTKPK